jgi:hypothetical protein
MAQTKMSTSEKHNNLEQQFRSETGGELADLENLKISEAVGETVGENFSDGSSSAKQQTQREDDSQKLIKNSKARQIILPTIARQRARVQHALEHEQKHLIQKAKKMQNSRKFSASALEETYINIRRLQSLLDELLRAAGKRITELYRRYILKSG